ncbi:hypothetical protein [Mesorhizobium sp. KR2-14]|uniref:hypothetical protein n=1 Tax=Mesorhizobium sp. KR2-14 TaxID=3156610 RepID=UPI0032B4620E
MDQLERGEVRCDFNPGSSQMLIYGDRSWESDVETLRSSIRRALRIVQDLPPGLGRHAALVNALIKAGELAQAVADAEFNKTGFDHPSGSRALTIRLVRLLAADVALSWESKLAGELKNSHLEFRILNLVQECKQVLLPRKAEGFSYYAVYPEAYYEAARRSNLCRDSSVIGIRSIGASLACMVAAALGTRRIETVRPCGTPFQRRIAASESFARRIGVTDGKRMFAVVDEGPGLSGSSFASVGEWLERFGVTNRQVHFFPSHSNDPGKHVAPAQLQRWRTSQRHVCRFGGTILAPRDPAHCLASWVEDVIGPLEGPLIDMSAGGWREFAAGNGTLPCDASLERRKYLALASGERWLLKFAGLGEDGERKLHTGRLLARNGFIPEVIALCHGFLVQRWAEAETLHTARVPNERLLPRLTQYLSFRARLPAPGSGASLKQLVEMAWLNVSEAMGNRQADRLEIFFRRFGSVEGVKPRRVDTDGRLHPGEWLHLADGTLLKTDALDHSSGHDIVGCQDIAWDIAGAAIEHELAATQLKRLCRQMEGVEIERELVQLMMPCYIAHQLGSWTFARERASSSDKAAIDTLLRKYRAALFAFLEG